MPNKAGLILSFAFLIIFISNAKGMSATHDFNEAIKGAENGKPGTADSVPNAVPTLCLEKPKYVLGEAIRFWAGVECLNDDVIIPQQFWGSCFLYITSPDKTTKREPMSWPIDGDLYRGWKGGCGLGKEPVQTGKYTLVFEFAGKKTKPVELIVEDLDILNNIKATFNFK